MNYTNQLLENLRKSKVYLFFRDNNLDTDLADMQLISKYNKGYPSAYAWVFPLISRKGLAITNEFQNNF